jgi:hypothetical protein
MIFKETKKFEKDLKQLYKKFRSIAEDLELFKKLVAKIPLGNNRHFAVLHVVRDVKIIKARMSCRSLKNSSSSLRVIYAYHEKTDEIELIEFIELYSKGHKEREDQARIQEYIESLR